MKSVLCYKRSNISVIGRVLFAESLEILSIIVIIVSEPIFGIKGWKGESHICFFDRSCLERPGFNPSKSKSNDPELVTYLIVVKCGIYSFMLYMQVMLKLKLFLLDSMMKSRNVKLPFLFEKLCFIKTVHVPWLYVVWNYHNFVCISGSAQSLLQISPIMNTIPYTWTVHKYGHYISIKTKLDANKNKWFHKTNNIVPMQKPYNHSINNKMQFGWDANPVHTSF